MAVACATILEDRTDLRSEKYEMEWNGFWHFHNVMQFTNNFVAISEKGLSEKVYLALSMPETELSVQVESEEGAGDGWDIVMRKMREFADENELSFISALRDKKIPVPDIIADELTEGDTVIDIVELAWSEKKIAFVLSEFTEVKGNIIKAGWTVFDEHEERVDELFGGEDHA